MKRRRRRRASVSDVLLGAMLDGLFDAMFPPHVPEPPPSAPGTIDLPPINGHRVTLEIPERK